ncbi:MAG: VIT1/CCC1 transporter family protein [Candidatus Nanopelagicaceae bacterium]|jgi:VIT1/CCC1 family predicted Fe2+/Mn2+ transporter
MPLQETMRRNQEHRAHRAGWLRAAVLGVNDGLVSTASLMVGVAAAMQSNSVILTTGLAGIAAGALSMAVGEYVSVWSQVDIEESDRKLEADQHATNPEGEFLELVQIYMARGLSEDLAKQVAEQMHAHDALETHLRDELGQHEHTKANPVQASIASALSFTFGGLIPFLGFYLPIIESNSIRIFSVTVLGLAVAGVISSVTAGTNVFKGTSRVVLGGIIGMVITGAIGSLAHGIGL